MFVPSTPRQADPARNRLAVLLVSLPEAFTQCAFLCRDLGTVDHSDERRGRQQRNGRTTQNSVRDQRGSEPKVDRIARERERPVGDQHCRLLRMLGRDGRAVPTESGDSSDSRDAAASYQEGCCEQ